MEFNWEITVTVAGKTIPIACGEGMRILADAMHLIGYIIFIIGVQRIKWLAHVAIARWDDDEHQGWKRLGVPTGLFI